MLTFRQLAHDESSDEHNALHFIYTVITPSNSLRLSGAKAVNTVLTANGSTHNPEKILDVPQRLMLRKNLCVTSAGHSRPPPVGPMMARSLRRETKRCEPSAC